ncbi:hypothetical protein N7448_008239 [Penicillium atrosanguineum]|uniref:Uncharacterized protein n=1 Tax=Penicillium atrosanguineum TaxID=1132637 RepID=A0A9W9QC54_9EURO|nr:uncharacterized protein N7443_000747 [Penicillium atrosanguineum]KAJ5127460.1 hypothetical protein N7448_008239 [Penicillium atrosanguineum]KAJ5147664.1 hypothetical protein N7526_001016 [Penicillium atrosanguineum]KAJ5313863.1 hypothetical protein N7443_000747 [Penicillium atrosanguineum]KAJ5331034.1 hypothetical protein N7476_000817 [Penicillium atrosanguineum]
MSNTIQHFSDASQSRIAFLEALEKRVQQIELDSRIKWPEDNLDKFFEDMGYYEQIDYQDDYNDGNETDDELEDQVYSASDSDDDPYRRKTLDERAATLVNRIMN